MHVVYRSPSTRWGMHDDIVRTQVAIPLGFTTRNSGDITVDFEALSRRAQSVLSPYGRLATISAGYQKIDHPWLPATAPRIVTTLSASSIQCAR